MKRLALFTLISLCNCPINAMTSDAQLRQDIQRSQRQTVALQKKLDALQHRIARKKSKPSSKTLKTKPAVKSTKKSFNASEVYVHSLKGHPESVEFFPTALLSDDERVITYIAGTPVVSAPYLGSRPAFDGSDYIVNISSINRDVRLLQQRRQLYNAYRTIGYPAPDASILAISGKAEPIGSIGDFFSDDVSDNWDLGSAEIDIAAAVNDKVQAYVSFAYDLSPDSFSNQRIANSALGLGMGFINIGDLDESPYYLTAGQLFVPFGRYSSSMISAPLTMIMSRTKNRPVILGYKSQYETGPFAAIYGFRGDTTLNNAGVGGVNLGYIFRTSPNMITEVGASFISSINNATGMQATGSTPGTTFGGFGSIVNGNEAVKTIPGIDFHLNSRFDRYILTAEWVGVTQPFRTQDLSYNGHGARPQAAQLEGAATFIAFTKPASFAVGYQWSNETLALNMPQHRISTMFNISIWRDTVETIEYRHDIDYARNQFANGAAPAGSVNATTFGSGKASDTLLAQIGVYF